MNTNDLLYKYDSLVNKDYLALIPECEGDVLYIIDLRTQIQEKLDSIDFEARQTFIKKLVPIDDRLKSIARSTRDAKFILPDGIRSKDWWTNLDNL